VQEVCKDQVVDYAKRKGIERVVCEKDLSTILAYSPEE
jgi:hypothetical protein